MNLQKCTCGATPRLDGSAWFPGWRVFCTQCHANTKWFPVIEKAIAAWNRDERWIGVIPAKKEYQSQ